MGTKKVNSSSEILLDKIFKDGPLGMIFSDKSFNFIKVNSAFCKMLGYTEKELLKMTFVDITHPDFIKDNIILSKKILKGEIQSFESEKIYIRKNKKPFWASVKITKVSDKDGNFNHFLGMIEDINERKLAELALKNSEKKYRMLHESMIDGFVSVDMKGKFIESNEIYRKMLGYTSEELSKLTYNDITPKKWHKFEKKIIEEQILSKGFSEIYEKEYIRKDGTIFPVELHTSLIKDENGRNEMMWAIVRDISERKKVEEERLFHLQLYENMDKINRAMQGTNDIEQMMSNVLKIVLTIFNCDRTWLLYPCDPDSQSFRVPMEITKPEYPGAKVLNIDVPMSPGEAQNMREALESDEPVTYTAGTERPISTAKQFGVKSQMFIPIYTKSGKPWVFGIHQCSHARVWTKEEKKLFQEISWRLSDSLSNFLIWNDLKESEERYRLIAENTADTISILDLKLNPVYISPSVEKLRGYTVQEAMAQPLNQVLTPESMAKAENILAEQMELEINGTADPSRTVMLELEEYCKDGSNVVVELSASFFRDQNLKPNGILTVTRDATERKRAEEKLIETKNYLENLINSANAPIMVWDPEFKITRFNNAFENITGYKSSDVIGEEFNFLFPEETKNKSFEEIGKTLRGNKWESVEIPILCSNGDVRIILWNSANIYNNVGKTIIATIAQGLDITERKKAEELLMQSEENYRNLIENVNVGVISSNSDGAIIKANKKAYDILGYDSEHDTFKFLISDIYYNKEDREDLMNTLIAEGMIHNKEFKMKKKNGTYVWINLSATASFDDSGKIFRVDGVIDDISEEKKLRDDLKLSEELFRKVNSSALDAVIIIDDSDKITFWNQSAERIFGWKSEEAIGKKFHSILVNKKHQETFNKKFPEFIKTGKGNVIGKITEITAIKKDGTVFPVEISLNSIEVNEKRHAIGVVRDITERKQAEKALVKSELRFKQVSENAREWIWEVDKNGLYTYTSPIVKDIMGYKPEEILNKKYFYDLFIPQDREEIKQLAFGAFARKESFKDLINRNLHKDGREIILSSSGVPILDNEGNLMGYRGVDIDVTEQKRAEESLRESESKYKNLIETMPVGFYRSTPEGYFVDANPTLVKMLRYDSKEELMKIYIPEALYFSKDERESITYNIDFIPDTEVYRLKKKDGSEIWIEDYARYIRDSSGNIIYHEGIMRDITESLSAKQAIIEAKEKAEESSRLKTSFLANMSHELRTPMVGILGYTELMKETLEDSEMKEMAEGIYTSGKRLMETLNLILDLSIIEHGKLKVDFKKTDIVSITEDVLNLYQATVQKKNLKIGMNSLFEKYIVNLDGKLLFQVISNLVNNGIKYTKSGSINVEIAKEIESGNEWAVIKVKDTGIGIPEDKLDFIFEEFRQVSEGYSRSFEGTGLGLTITKNFVKAMNGNISVESKIGSGSVFTVKFPLSNRPNPDAVNIKLFNDESLKISLPQGNYKILCVDDDETNNNLVGLILGENYKIDFALTAEKSIELSKNNKYDIILMDINLGYGMTGIDVIREIKKFEMNESTPIVALTAFTMKGDMQEFLANGCDYYLSKPYTTRGLKELIKKIIKKENS